jgi:hypothetical protein
VRTEERRRDRTGRARFCQSSYAGRSSDRTQLIILIFLVLSEGDFPP